MVSLECTAQMWCTLDFETQTFLRRTWLVGFTEGFQYCSTSLIESAQQSQPECLGSLAQPLNPPSSTPQRESSLAVRSRSSKGSVSNLQTCSSSWKRHACSFSRPLACWMTKNWLDLRVP